MPIQRIALLHGTQTSATRRADHLPVCIDLSDLEATGMRCCGRQCASKPPDFSRLQLSGAEACIRGSRLHAALDVVRVLATEDRGPEQYVPVSVRAAPAEVHVAHGRMVAARIGPCGGMQDRAATRTGSAASSFP